jgi:hypothetical protein
LSFNMHAIDIRISVNTGKCQENSSTDILRIPEKCRKCRYAKISQFLEAGQFCRYVGGIAGFSTGNTMVFHSNFIIKILLS